jgi:RNA polymerase sigma-70 factor (ECF subfamily)
VYCIVPEDLAAKLHEPLRAHFADVDVEVVVEQRWRDRRNKPDRRVAEQPAPLSGEDRRRIKGILGRRAADRRAATITVDGHQNNLPRSARPHADKLVFVERLLPSDQQLEDRNTARLVARFQAGDSTAFAELYMRYFDRLYSYLRIVLGQSGDAEEAVQQVFANVLVALTGYEPRKVPFRGWLFVVARNQAITQLRRTSRLEPQDPADLDHARGEEIDETGPPTGEIGWISDSELLMFVERLPVAQRQVLALRYTLDLSHAQIGAILGRSPEDVRMQLSRAQRFLRERLTAVGRGTTGRHRAPLMRRTSQAYLLRARRFALLR